jgi:hypothetical protein
VAGGGERPKLGSIRIHRVDIQGGHWSAVIRGTLKNNSSGKTGFIFWGRGATRKSSGAAEEKQGREKRGINYKLY